MFIKPIIGIVTHKSKSEENHNINYIYEDIEKSITDNGGIPIAITLHKDFENLINICDGIIFQGGDDFEKYDLETLNYVHSIDKPVLGICLGMQLMGIMLGGEMIDVKNHKKKLYYAHSIKIKRNSKLYNIFKQDIVKVNSRHKSALININKYISAISDDGVVEGIEDDSKKFFIGIQWHPENMISYDSKQNNLFKTFINACKKNI